MRQAIILLLIILLGCNTKSPETKNVEKLYDYDIEERIKELGIQLSEPTKPVANYVNSVITGNLVFMAGKGPRRPDETMVTGKVG
ncbi:MAG: RidA family protein, partial [Cyclobacteriaceae bacterium]|nr:RidA family protein [Cyclobacteriaceae bacterium]